MSAGITAKPEGFKEAQAAFEKLARRAPEDALKAISETCVNIENDAKQNCTVGVSGQLRSSIHHIIEKKDIRGRVIADGGHAAFVEFGTRAHFPPVSALERWVQLVLGVTGKRVRTVAYLVARAISRRGTPAQPFLHPALEANVGEYVRRLKEFLKGGMK